VTHAALHTRVCELFGVEFPIVQTGMGWVAGARLTSATSAAGGLGILASATMTYDELALAITEVKARTGKPFGVNLRADQPDISARLDLLIREGVRVASFAQAPSRDVIAKLKDAGIVTMPTVGARRHAEKVAEWGVDAVIDTVDIPVLGAGGFTDGRGLVAALAWGASGIAMGTRFLLTKDSTVPDAVKEVYLTKSVTDTVVTTAIDGYPQRVVRTDVVDEIERASLMTRLPKAVRRALEFRKLTSTSYRDLLTEGLAMKRNQDLTWSQLAMAANAPMLIKASMVDGRPEVGILPTGQGIGVIDELPTVAELIGRIMAEARTALDQLSG
jgi:NAD(P)H-dependent flavin oxidoreductase YrpB (nitropropane dioxygenase family)